MMASQRGLLTQLAGGHAIVPLGNQTGLGDGVIQDLRWLESAGWIQDLKMTASPGTGGERYIGAMAKVTKKGHAALEIEA